MIIDINCITTTGFLFLNYTLPVTDIIKPKSKQPFVYGIVSASSYEEVPVNHFEHQILQTVLIGVGVVRSYVVFLLYSSNFSQNSMLTTLATHEFWPQTIIKKNMQNRYSDWFDITRELLESNPDTYHGRKMIQLQYYMEIYYYTVSIRFILTSLLMPSSVMV